MCKIITTRDHDCLHKNFNVQFLKLLILVIEAVYIHVKFKVIKLIILKNRLYCCPSKLVLMIACKDWILGIKS